MKKIALPCLILLLASLMPAAAEDFEPFFRITPQAGYITLPITRTYGPVAVVQADWGARWLIGVELLYTHLYDYEHSYDDLYPGDPGYGEPDIWDAFGAEVVGGYFIGNPGGFGGHVELGLGTMGEILSGHLGLGLDLALGEDIGLSVEGRAGYLFYGAVTLGVTFFIH
jgi:hypothetical protein